MFLGFASDNTAGAHPRILKAIEASNTGYEKPYGEDYVSLETDAIFAKLFGPNAKVFFALTGTGANVLALRAIAKPWHGIICADVAHINTEESGAPEWGVGAKLLPVPSKFGKITPDGLDQYLSDRTNFHRSFPSVLSLTQVTEKGTVYTAEEIRALCDKAHKNGLLVHMDGSRIANACAALNMDVRAFTEDAGVDVLAFGGAKNGLLMGEAVVFFDRSLAEEFTVLRKQSLQLPSKTRFLAAQFNEFLRDGLWLECARHANGMAQLFAQKLATIPAFSVRKPEANSVFVCMSPEHIAKMREDFYFYEVDTNIHEVRLMCSFATTEAEIDAFIAKAKSL